MRASLLIAAVLVSACGGSMTAPTVTPVNATTIATAPLICASGQSNMGDRGDIPPPPNLPIPGLFAVLQRLTRAQGWSYGAETIAYWHPDQHGWIATAPYLVPACAAFVWFQGESDDVGNDTYGPTPAGVYRLELADLIARVRARTAPSLPVYVVQIAPRFVTTRTEQAAACSADAHCTYVTTDDLMFPDGTHLDSASLEILAQRIITQIR